MSPGKLVQTFFMLFLVIGVVVVITDEIYRALHKEKFLYLNVRVWSGGEYRTAIIRDKKRIEEISELFHSLKSFKGTVWFGVPDMETCPVEVWNNYEEEFYRICKGKNGKWYVELPGNYKGRSTTNYYKVSEQKVRKVINLLKSMTNKLL